MGCIDSHMPQAHRIPVPCTVNTVAADNLVTEQGVRTSVAVTPFTNID